MTVSCIYTYTQIHTHKHTHATHTLKMYTYTHTPMYALYAHDDSHEPTDRTHFVHLSFSTLHHLVTVSSPLTSSENGPIAPKEPINLGRPGGGSFGMLISIWRRGSSLRGGAPLAISIAVIPKDHMSLGKKVTLKFSVSYTVSGLTCETDLLYW